jgi:DNA-binding CsgD family transcriptional regulator
VIAIDADTRIEVEGLLCQLLACIGEPSFTCTSHVTEPGVQEVLFDLEVGGIHYTLARIRPPPDYAWVSLSPREKEVIRLVCAGLPNKAISDVLEISPWTVGSYLKRIFAKLAVGSRAEMVARVLNEGLLGGIQPNHTYARTPSNGATQPLHPAAEAPY